MRAQSLALSSTSAVEDWHGSRPVGSDAPSWGLLMPTGPIVPAWTAPLTFQSTSPTVETEAQRQLMKEIAEEENARSAARLRQLLAKQIAEGSIAVEFDHNAVAIRIMEQGSFPSGSAELTSEFLPIIPILQQALTETPGAIAVEGHTDNVPIHTQRYRSNWELSSQRAVTFAHALMNGSSLSPNRFMIVGYADSRPRAPNDHWKNRAENRRVEILIRRSPEHAQFGL